MKIIGEPTTMDKTLEYYNQEAQDYTSDTIHADVSNLYPFFLSHLPPNATIMDLGCGPGRDSVYFLRKGYRVLSVDGAQEFCKLASKLTGQDVLCQTFENIDFTEEFDGIWACASILHVPMSGLPKVLENISRALKKGGYFYASFKYGSFEGERNGRYFTDMTEESFVKLIEKFEELEIVETMVTGDVRVGREDEKWLNVVVRKG
jgi:SAM-dependent methyltransferase